MEPGADVVAQGDGLGVVPAAQNAEDQAATGICRVDAVMLHIVPGLVLRDSLIHPIRLDQAQERLAREVELADRRLQLDEHGPRGGAPKSGVDLQLELVERRQPGLRATLELVAEDVDEASVRVEGANVRPQLARKRERGDRKILATRALCYGGNVEHR